MADATKKNDAIHLEKGTFAEAVRNLNTALQSLETATSAADSAIQDAIDSVGGPKTAVGGAIVDNCQTANDKEFKESKNSVETFIDSLGIIDNTVQDVEAGMLQQLQALNGSDSGTV